MNALEAIAARRSARAFSAREVPVELLEKILGLAAEAPTGGNMQPWQVAVVQGGAKRKLSAAYIEAAEKMQAPQPDIPYYPEPMPAKYDMRRRIMSARIYRARGIKFDRDGVDWPAVIDLLKQNYYFFGAGAGLLFFIERALAAGSLLDIGMFMQNIMLAAEAHGLATCAQASWGNYPHLAREVLGIDDDWRLICGMSIGYPAKEKLPPRLRENPAEFVKWFS